MGVALGKAYVSATCCCCCCHQPASACEARPLLLTLALPARQRQHCGLWTRLLLVCGAAGSSEGCQVQLLLLLRLHA